MPSYVVSFMTEGLTSIKSLIAFNMTSAIDAIIDIEAGKWKGRIVEIKLEKTRD